MIATLSPWVVGSGLLQVALFVVGAPLLLGLMRTVRCRMEGRIGPPIRQPWRDLRKLFAKGRTQPERSTFFFASAPVVLVATTVVVVWLAPLLSTRVSLAGGSDLFAIVFLLLLGSVALSLAALDTGTAFGGMFNKAAAGAGLSASGATTTRVRGMGPTTPTGRSKGLSAFSVSPPMRRAPFSSRSPGAHYGS